MRGLKYALVSLLFCLVSCYSLTITPISYEKLPKVWVVPELTIRMQAEISPDDPMWENVKKLVIEFNKRLYDAFDGQVRIEKIIIVNASYVSQTQSRTGTVIWTYFKPFVDRNAIGLGFVGNPSTPGYFYTTMYNHERDLGRCASTMVHEWMHSWIGLGDEYKLGENRDGVSCPEDIRIAIRDDACVMDRSWWHRELCREKNHNHKTDQGSEHGMACYEYAAKIMREKGVANITVPPVAVPGPTDPPDPKVEFRK